MRGRSLDVLLALLPDDGADALSGEDVVARLDDAGRSASASAVLSALLDLEASGHVAVARSPYRFALTPLGASAALELAPSQHVEVGLVMVDLVEFVAYTAAAGDAAAHGAARRLCEAAETGLTRSGGWLVKGLGDGFLGALAPGADPVAFVRSVRRHATRDDGSAWPVRAAAHVGRPIRHRNDLFGADVNLVARLCAAARPDELVLSDPTGAGERLAVRGLDEPVPVRRVALT